MPGCGSHALVAPFARFSSIDRLLECAGGAVMQADGDETKSEYTKTAADWGTMVHHWKETGEIITVNDRKNLPPLFEKKLRESGVRRDVWWPESLGILHETAVAVAPFEEYRMSDEGGRDEKDAWKKAHSDRFATGTCDGRWWMFDTLTIEDLKTGREVTYEQHQGQVTGYALGVARALDYRGPVSLMICHWPRYPVVGVPRRFGKVVEQDELLAFEKRLSRLRDDVLRGREAAEKMRLRTGEHCLYCPSKRYCPEWAKEYGNG